MTPDKQKLEVTSEVKTIEQLEAEQTALSNQYSEVRKKADRAWNARRKELTKEVEKNSSASLNVATQERVKALRNLNAAKTTAREKGWAADKTCAAAIAKAKATRDADFAQINSEVKAAKNALVDVDQRMEVIQHVNGQEKRKRWNHERPSFYAEVNDLGDKCNAKFDELRELRKRAG